MELKLKEGKEVDAVIAALRLLQRSMDQGLVATNDGDVGDILTNGGAHEAISIEEIDRIVDRIQWR